MFGLRSRSRYRFPVTLSALLIAANVSLMVVWIVLFARGRDATALTLGVVAFGLVLVGLIIWLVLTIKEINLNRRQANFVDAVTHELKTPIASIQLCLDTLRMRPLSPEKTAEFHETMATELARLDHLISQLLEVGRLDALGEGQAAETVDLRELTVELAGEAARRYGLDAAEAVTVVGPTAHVEARPLVVRLIVSNLVDNAFKYGGAPPRVRVRLSRSGGRARAAVASNGQRIPYADRQKIFRVFYRGGDELERRQTGTGLGLYIVSTLARRLKGSVTARDRSDGGEGAEFVLDLPAADVSDATPTPG